MFVTVMLLSMASPLKVFNWMTTAEKNKVFKVRFQYFLCCKDLKILVPIDQKNYKSRFGEQWK